MMHSVMCTQLVTRHGPKRYLDPSDIILDIMQLWGIYTQKIIISPSKVPITVDDIQDLQNGQILIWTMPTCHASGNKEVIPLLRSPGKGRCKGVKLRRM
jgi:hypothetical protein